MFQRFLGKLRQLFASKRSMTYPFLGFLVFFILLIIVYIARQPALSVLQDHIEAVKQGNLREAYDLTSSVFQDQVSYTVFESFFLFSTPNIETVKIKNKDKEQNMTTIKTEFTFKDTSSPLSVTYILTKDSQNWRINAIDASKEDSELKAIGVGIPAIVNVQVGNGLSEEPSVLKEQSDFGKYETIDMVGQVRHIKPGAELTAVLYNLEQDREIARKILSVPQNQDSFIYFFSFSRGEEGLFVGNYEIRLMLRTGGENTPFIYRTYSVRVI